MRPKAGNNNQPKPSALFMIGVADDGMVRLLPETMESRRDNKSLREVFGSLSHHKHVSVPGLTNEVITLIGEQEQVLNFNIPQVIINCIVDADIVSHALTKQQKLIDLLRKQSGYDIPVINPPAGIARTTREKIYEQFKDLPALRIPRVIRIVPTSVADTVQKIKDAGFTLPVLMRAIGTHGGQSMQIIESWSPEETLKLERYAYDGRAFYVIEWVDFKSSDGFYRKCRLACVNGEFIPRHRIVTDSWNVHSRSRKALMNDREDLRKEEEAFLSAPLAKSISKEALASLKRIYETLGLGYFGIDCAINDDGSLTIFEINAAINAMVQRDLGVYPYLAKSVQRIIRAFNDMVANQAALARAA